MTTEVIITACTQETMEKIMRLVHDGMPIRTIAESTNFPYGRVQKYIRLYERFGPDVFIKRKYAA